MKHVAEEEDGLLRGLRSWNCQDPNVGLEGAASFVPVVKKTHESKEGLSGREAVYMKL